MADSSNIGASSSDSEVTDEICVAKALSLKDAGTQALKEGSLALALEKYQEGLTELKKSFETTDPQYKLAHKSLNSNIALVAIKLKEYHKGLQATKEVLKSYPDEVKILYRRGVCYSNLGYYDEAEVDFLRVKELDPTNSEAQRELLALKQKVIQAKRAEKKTFGGFFNKHSGLYDDLENQKLIKAQEEAAKRAKYETRYEEETAELPEDTRPSFDDWYKLEQDREMEEKKREEQLRRERQRANQQITQTAKQTEESTLEFDDEDRKILEETAKKGYCYFRREPTEAEKQLRKENVPTLVTGDISPSFSMPDTAERKGVSDWNARGTTYEEKDVSSWCSKRLREVLMEITNMDSQCKIQAVNDLKTDGQIIVAKGKLRRFYEFSAEVKMEVALKESSDLVALRFKMEDITSNRSGNIGEELATCACVVSEPNPCPMDKQNEARQIGLKAIEKALEKFEAEYREK